VIPSFNASGVLPPFSGSDPGQQAHLSSPYKTTMSAFVERFSTSAARCEVISGLLRLRSALREIGITSGFQLLDGSFVEDCERVRGRPPNDIDLVTFAYLPVVGHEVPDFVQENLRFFDRDAVKNEFKCDSFFVDLSKDARYVVADTMYWYGLFSHQRDSFLWKGMVSVPLMSDDQQALQLLADAEARHAQAA
jgi:hypothetical protein